MGVVRIRLQRQIQAPPRAVWTSMSNTDAFNRTAALDHRYTKPTLEPRGRVVHHGSFWRLGQELRWRELAFRFVAPNRFHCERVFDGGPVASLTAEFTIEPAGTGTELVYEVVITPRFALLRPVLALEAALLTRPTLQRTLDAIVAAVQDGLPHFDPPPPLRAAQAELLDHRLRAVTEPTIQHALRALIHEAPLREQDRIQPLRVAGQLGVAADQVVDGCLQAVATGALEARFLLLCPRCLGAKEALTTVDFSSRQVHCDTCNIGYDGALADNIELAFRPAPDVREVAVQVDCIQSPSFTPHVLAQETLAPGGWLELSIELEVGCHRIETSGGGDPLHLEVLPTGDSALTADVLRFGLHPRRAEVGAGRVSLYLRNRTPDALVVAVADRARPPEVLTVGAFLQHPTARTWARAHQGLDAQVHDGVVVAVVDAPFSDGGGHALEAMGASHLQQANGQTLAVFEQLAPALQAAIQVSSASSIVAIASGVLLRTEGLFGQVTLGPTVDRVTTLPRRVGWGRIAVDQALADDPGLAERLATDHPSVELMPGWGARPPLLRLSALRAPNDAIAPSWPTRHLGPFAIGEEIGRGSMGVVYEATQAASGAEVVVKVLGAEQSSDARFVASFYNEARLGWTVVHPNVVRVLDWGCDPDTGRLFLVMERLDGPNLHQQQQLGRLSPSAVLDLARDLLDGLAAVHDAGVIHRDLKPANIALTSRGGVILDFGIAHRADVRNTTFAGSVAWMSPEQGQQRGADVGSDLYQLALVLCFAACGELPFPADDAMDALLWRTRNDLDALPPGVPPALESVLLRALRREPDERYASAQAMRSAIDPR